MPYIWGAKIRPLGSTSRRKLTCVSNRGSLGSVPTVKVIGAYRFFFSSSDGREPPHIHVEVERRVAKFWLDPVEMSKGGRLSAHVLREIQRLVLHHRVEFLKAWHEYFGN
ncbi:MAG TPA: DUF4160 domain-containing protein [Thermoanaerobaculia bacterium]